METTALYVELIVIGIEAMSWIYSFLVYFTDIQYLPKAVAFLGNLSASFFLLGILYALGMVVDRMADVLFQPLEDRAKAKAKIQAESTILIWKDVESYFQFTRSKLRILRASAMNFPITTIGILINLSRYVPHDKRLFCCAPRSDSFRGFPGWIYADCRTTIQKSEVSGIKGNGKDSGNRKLPEKGNIPKKNHRDAKSRYKSFYSKRHRFLPCFILQVSR